MFCPFCGLKCKQVCTTVKALSERSCYLWQCPSGHGTLADDCRLTHYSDGRREGTLQFFRTTQRAKRALLARKGQEE